jgi:hypothetical protein
MVAHTHTSSSECRTKICLVLFITAGITNPLLHPKTLKVIVMGIMRTADKNEHIQFFLCRYGQLKTAVCSIMTPYYLVRGYQSFGGIYHPEDGGDKFHQNVSIHLEDYMTS